MPPQLGQARDAINGGLSLVVILMTALACWRASRPPNPMGLRRRARVLALALVVAFLYPSVWLVLRSTVAASLYSIWFYGPAILCLASFPLIIGYSIIRHQMFDLRIVLRQSLVYGLLSGVLSVGYLVMGLAAYQLLGEHGQSRVVVGITVAALVLAFSLLKVHVQAWMDRVVFRSREL